MAGISDKALNKLDSKNKFNGGVELEEDYGVNLYSTFYREYDPQIGRFTGIDALSEMSANVTSYQYAINDPISFNDPTGLLSTQDSPETLETVIITMPSTASTGISIGVWDALMSQFGDGSFYAEFGGGGGGGGAGFDPGWRNKVAKKLANTYKQNERRIMAYSLTMEALAEVTSAGELLTKTRDALVDTYGDDDSKEASEVYSQVIDLVRGIKEDVAGGELTDSYIAMASTAFGAKAIALGAEDAALMQTVKMLDGDVYHSLNPGTDYRGGGGGASSSY